VKKRHLTSSHIVVRVLDMSRILDQLRKAVRANPKSCYRLSKETGIDQAQLSRMMSGQEGLGVENLEKLADALALEIVARKRGRKGR